MELRFETAMEPNTVVLFETTSGKEVIAKVVEVTDTEIVVENAHIIFVGQDPQTLSPRLQMVPYYAAVPASEKVAFDKKQIVSRVFSVPAHTERAFIQQTSGISLTNQLLAG